MNAVMEIKLHKVKLFGLHGLHAGEEVIGSQFEVSLTASFIPQRQVVEHIEDTLDYTVLLQIVKKRMQRPTHLLETLATEIASEIIAKFSIVTEVEISIYKLHPPIESFDGSVGVCYKIKRN